MTPTTLQMPQLQIEDIASVLALAKTAKIEAGDAIAVGAALERVELALTIGKLQRAAQPQPDAPTTEPAGQAPNPVPAQTGTPSKIDEAVQKATAPQT